ncbi:metallophosphoesterase family protein [Chloroflexi bacterium TSY]|nr:metallophosphoesterase family protein [Chloroflexi bacterium TSY]
MNQNQPITRRNLLRRAFISAGVVGMTALGGYGYATRIETEWIAIKRVKVPVQNLPETAAGFKIVHMSDFHLHPFTQIEQIQRAVALANSLQPDIAVLTGDFVLESAESIFELAPALARLNTQYGIYAVVGNHDLWTNVHVIEHGLTAAGIRVLKNNGVMIGGGQDLIYLAGLDDGCTT